MTIFSPFGSIQRHVGMELLPSNTGPDNLRDEQFNARDEYAGSGSSSNAGEVEGMIHGMHEVSNPQYPGVSWTIHQDR